MSGNLLTAPRPIVLYRAGFALWGLCLLGMVMAMEQWLFGFPVAFSQVLVVNVVIIGGAVGGYFLRKEAEKRSHHVLFMGHLFLCEGPGVVQGDFWTARTIFGETLMAVPRMRLDGKVVAAYYETNHRLVGVAASMSGLEPWWDAERKAWVTMNANGDLLTVGAGTADTTVFLYPGRIVREESGSRRKLFSPATPPKELAP